MSEDITDEKRLILQILEDYYPDTWREIIEAIEEGVYE